MDTLFIETVLVQPSKFRPKRFMAGRVHQHPITVNLQLLMEADQELRCVKGVMTPGIEVSLAMKVTEMGYRIIM